ncbi:MAG: hypothetical protein IIX51_00520 [Methanocorpusculum sp.]|nr:hypothetical protein [Methanocorpusculum sp.]MEE1136438.1 hypothetical protein [Methanocorpusculum sp.]HJJ68358.1 hypothetical protein [Methanocorpusculum sp.]HJJ73737.1 hypothetical protein [Methanocorpusculum sp.]HJJ76978.1 hypothetical protein [Methanocorpusculum sp.]
MAQVRTAGFDVLSLYRTSFPKEERFPFLFLHAIKLRRSCKFLSYCKNGCLAGMSFTVEGPDMDENADNADERRRRFAFYERNGFYDTGYLLRDTQMTYTVLSTAKDFKPDVYYETLKGLHPSGVGVPEILKKIVLVKETHQTNGCGLLSIGVCVFL